MYLVDPTGARYEASHFTEDGPWRLSGIASWQPLATQALARQTEFDADGYPGDSRWGVLDIVTGEFTVMELPGSPEHVLGVTPGGSTLLAPLSGERGVVVVDPDYRDAHMWSLRDAEEYYLRLSPDGTTVAGVAESRRLTLYDADTGEVKTTADAADFRGDRVRDHCAFGGWVGPSTPALTCGTATDATRETLVETRFYGLDGGTAQLVSTVESHLRFLDPQPSSQGLLAGCWENFEGVDGGLMCLVDGNTAREWPQGDGVGWPTVMAAGAVDVVCWRSSWPGFITGQDAQGAAWDIVPRNASGDGNGWQRLGAVAVGAQVGCRTDQVPG